MRILFIVHQFRPEYATGTETVIFNIAKACQRAGHGATVLTCALHDAAGWTVAPEDGLWFTTVQGLPVYGVPATLVSNPFGVCAAEEFAAKELVRRFLSDKTFDVAHIGHSLRMLPAIEVLTEVNLPYVVTLTDFFPLCYRINLIRISGDPCDGPHGGRACLTHCPVEGDPSWRLERSR